MKTSTANESGFSAVELLITLFVAAAFVATGYQLYSVILKDGGEARTRAKATNIAYDNLRRYSPKAVKPCAAVTPSPTPTIPAGSGLLNPSITVTITCPSGTGTTSVSKVQVTVTYGPSPQEQVVHALFVTK
jgi:Tfp pilus assembly protein PilV